MKTKTFSKMAATGVLAGITLVSADASAAFAPFDAPEVLLRKNCAPAGVPLSNCFDNLNNLNAWIRDTRKPNAARPLHVDVGPGTFEGQFKCQARGIYTGYVTIAGSGTGNTVLKNRGPVITTRDCLNLVFRDMTISNVTDLGQVPVDPSGPIAGIYGHAADNTGGSTTWHSVDVFSAGYGWIDGVQGCSNTVGEHRWYSSRILAGGEWAFYGICDKSWFFGSQIETKLRNRVNPNADRIGAIVATARSQLFVYGGNVRFVADNQSPAQSLKSLMGVAVAGKETEVHLHGVGIDVVSSLGLNVTGLFSRGGLIHANESAFVLKTGTGGKRTRTENQRGKLLSPYTWQTGRNAPNIYSETGYDQVVVTNTQNGHPRLLISDKQCDNHNNNNKAGWWDTHASTCWVY